MCVVIYEEATLKKLSFNNVLVIYICSAMAIGHDLNHLPSCLTPTT